jgi:hypothetical protein
MFGGLTMAGRHSGNENPMPVNAFRYHVMSELCIVRILRLELESPDLIATAAFYSRLLKRAFTPEENRLEITAGNTLISWRLSSGVKPVYHIAFTIPHNAIRDARDFVKSITGIITLPDGSEIVDFHNWNARSVYFHDTSGNVLEFIARHDLDNATTQKFDGSQVICVSEIGIVVPDVAGFVSGAMESLGIKPYAKQPVLKNFAALGDAHGLLIVSAEGRNWYPTDTPASRHAGTVWVDTGQKTVALPLSSREAL